MRISIYRSDVNFGRALAIAGAVLLCMTHLPAHAAQDVVAASIESLSSAPQEGVPLTFGHVFREGDIPVGTRPVAHLGDGTPIAIQMDRKATHRDGSLRHAVLTAVVPTLQAGAAESLIIGANVGTVTEAPVALSDLLATSFDAQVRLRVGGTDYSASARNLLTTGVPKSWLSGPLVSEWLVGGPVRTAGGSAHPHLAAYFHVRAYAGNPISRVRVDVVIENGWARVPEPGDLAYDAEISVGGQSRYSVTALTHYHHARWHKAFWWGVEPKAYVRLDHRYLQDTNAVSKYAELSPSETYLSSLRSRDAFDPMKRGDWAAALEGAGAGNHIGPLPRFDALFVVSSDRRAFGAMLANADAFGAWGQHYRDEQTGHPIDISAPGNSHAGLPGYGGGDFPRAVVSDNPYSTDGAHAPLAAYVPYLVTGDYYYLEELLFWTNQQLLRDIVIGSPNYPASWPRTIHKKQVRDQAWTLRNFGVASWITPDDHPLKDYLRAVITTNLDYYRTIYPANNSLGINAGRLTGTAIAPWMQNFFNYSLARLLELDHPEARDLLEFFGRWNTSTLLDPSFCWVFAVKYMMTVRNADTDPAFSTFRELYAANVDEATRSLTCGSQAMADKLGISLNAFQDNNSGATSYRANQQPAVAMLATLGVPGGAQAWQLVASRANQPKYDDYPNYAVVPRVDIPAGSIKPFPTVRLTASTYSVAAGESVKLTWSSTDASGCTAYGGWSGSRGISGETMVGPVQSAVTYRLDCVGDGGVAQASATVSLKTSTAPPPPPPGGGSVDPPAESSKEGGGGAADLWMVAFLMLLALRYASLRHARMTAAKNGHCCN